MTYERRAIKYFYLKKTFIPYTYKTIYYKKKKKTRTNNQSKNHFISDFKQGYIKIIYKKKQPKLFLWLYNF